MSMHRTIVHLAALGLAALILSACTPAAPITGITWKWTGTNGIDPADNIQVSNPENYTLSLLADGTIGIRNDCNNAGGSYQLSGSRISITLGATTLAYCGDASLDTVFMQHLSRVDSFQLENGRLILLFASGAGQMTFDG